MDYCGQRPPNRTREAELRLTSTSLSTSRSVTEPSRTGELVVAGFSRQTTKPGEARKNSTREAELRLTSTSLSTSRSVTEPSRAGLSETLLKARIVRETSTVIRVIRVPDRGRGVPKKTSIGTRMTLMTRNTRMKTM